MVGQQKKKPELFLTGPKVGAPSFEDVMALFTKITGREPTPQERADARKEWEKK